MSKHYFVDAVVLLAEKVLVLRDVVPLVQNACPLVINFGDERAFKDVFEVDVFANQVRKVDVLVRREIRAGASIHELAQGVYDLLKVFVVAAVGPGLTAFFPMGSIRILLLTQWEVRSECSGGYTSCGLRGSVYLQRNLLLAFSHLNKFLNKEWRDPK